MKIIYIYLLNATIPSGCLGFCLIAVPLQRIIQIQIKFVHNARDHKRQTCSILSFWIDTPMFSENSRISVQQFKFPLRKPIGMYNAMLCDRHTHVKFEFVSFSQYTYSDIPS